MDKIEATQAQGQGEDAEENHETEGPGILDTVSFSQQSAYLRDFNPQEAIAGFLSSLSPRERQIITDRWGLADGKPKTLENIGKQIGLTRERVRQIEKDGLKKLLKSGLPSNLAQGVDLIFQIIEERGDIVREDILVETITPSYRQGAGGAGILFLLSIVPRFNLHKESAEFHRAWYTAGFDQETAKKVIAGAKTMLLGDTKRQESADLVSRLKQSEENTQTGGLSEAAIESYLAISKDLGKNQYGEWGLASSPAIHPRDVGDKAFLVLDHHGQPEHYGKITELINKQHFDTRVANKESVHNELIKDDRFVLVGRGIYALKTWGYKEGVVADIISEILRDSGEPLTRDQIIAKVMKQRLVKKNTIIVGLSNRKLFEKTADNRYRLAATQI